MRGECCVCGDMREDTIRTHVVNGIRVDICEYPDVLDDCMSKLQETVDEIAKSWPRRS
jgi:hypothetical protein